MLKNRVAGTGEGGAEQEVQNRRSRTGGAEQEEQNRRAEQEEQRSRV